MKILNESTSVNVSLNQKEIIYYLKTENKDEIHALYGLSDRVRRHFTDDVIHIRGLLNISNHCQRNCLYCGLRSGNRHIKRYRMGTEEILEAVRIGCETGYKTVVLQSGEDDFYTEEMIALIIRSIKNRFDMAVTLSLGERPEPTLRKWFAEGADRYLLKHETSDPYLYKKLHPDLDYVNRIETLKILKKLSYETGSGIMIGLPGQTYESVARDIMLFKGLDIDMIGCGPYIHNPCTPLNSITADRNLYIQPELESVLKVTALNRIVTKDTLIPSTTALETISVNSGQINALKIGANVVMYDITPIAYKKNYEIYPKKTYVDGIKDYKELIGNLMSQTGFLIGKDHGQRKKQV